MTRETQKEKEKRCLEKFLSAMGWSADRIEGREKPDFMVTLAGRPIGVEVTTFHKDRNRRAAEEEWGRLLRELMAVVRNHAELLVVYGRLEFSCRQIPRGKDRSSFVREVVNLSLTHYPQEGKKTLNVQDFSGQYPLAARYLKTLKLKHTGVAMTWGWNLDVGFAASSEDQFLASIKDKVNKASTYDTTSLQALWLLVISGLLISQATRRFRVEQLDHWQRVNTMLANSPFDKTFFFLYAYGCVVEFDRSRRCWSVAQEGDPLEPRRADNGLGDAT